MKALILTLLIFTNSVAAAAEEVDCSGVKIDAQFGAQQARSGVALDDGLAALERSAKSIDEKLVKIKKAPLSRTTKERMKQAFRAGYSEAIQQPDQTIEQIAGQVAFACIASKYK